MINTRAEMINALTEAAEIEHGLLVQYLFAAFSIKRRENEGITSAQQFMLTQWESTILNVAREEMFHLANVFNMLSAIGGAPHLSRPNFPQPTTSSFSLGSQTAGNSYYPFDFQLERFNDSSLYRFIVFELPVDAEKPKPVHFIDGGEMVDPLVYNHVAQLYKLIEEGFCSIPEKELFIGTSSDQDLDTWGQRLTLHEVKDLTSARIAIQNIVEEGEGTAANRDKSHYGQFLKLRSELRNEQNRHPRFEPSRNVAINPQTRQNRDSRGSVTFIKHDVTLMLLELFNELYTTMLMMLMQYYSHGGETSQQRVALKNTCRSMMSAIFRPMSEILTEMPVSFESNCQMAGPSFEIYSPIHLSQDAMARWIILRERFILQLSTLTTLVKHASHYPVLARLNALNENLRYIFFNLEQYFPS